MTNRRVVFSVVLVCILLIHSAKAADNEAGQDIKQHEKKIEDIEEKKRRRKRKATNFQALSKSPQKRSGC